jgi:CheY-like chemotaxis protein
LDCPYLRLGQVPPLVIASALTPPHANPTGVPRANPLASAAPFAAEDGRDALERLAVTTADVVLMDVRMPVLDGVAATRLLIERDGAAGPRVIFAYDSGLVAPRR